MRFIQTCYPSDTFTHYNKRGEAKAKEQLKHSVCKSLFLTYSQYFIWPAYFVIYIYSFRFVFTSVYLFCFFLPRLRNNFNFLCVQLCTSAINSSLLSEKRRRKKIAKMWYLIKSKENYKKIPNINYIYTILLNWILGKETKKALDNY